MMEYVPLMMRPAWVLERYYGWTAIVEEPTLKLLRKRRGPVQSFLLLTRGAAEEAVEATAQRHRLLGPFAILAWNDFLPVAAEPRRIVLGRTLRRVDRERWFGVGTFVFDLSEDLDALWARMASRERTKCRKAEAQGVRVEFTARPDGATLHEFLELYDALAREKGLERPERSVLERMFRDGALLLARCVDAAGRLLVANLTYLQERDGYFLQGARADDVPPGAGQLAHWETVRRLKASGARFYDLGLVASRDDVDGIYRFKKALGGRFVDFGAEYQRVPAGLAAAYRAFRGARARLRARG